ncbi:hypothetical protein QE152_g13449 [Popillia japonica]|uniref:Uncharacterized protein n=1 Tax=Popillia japonica TaxID=7064 RepID=A0AAW1LDD3_POPJA
MTRYLWTVTPLLGVTETWLTAGMTDDAVSLDGYTIARRDRDDGRRGGGVALYIRNAFSFVTLGVALYIRNAFSFVTLDLPCDDNFEHV